MPRKRQRERDARTARASGPQPETAPHVTKTAQRAPKTSRAGRRSNYGWYRRVPWVAVGALSLLLVGAAVIALQLGVFSSAGRYVAGGGVGQHLPTGQAIAYPSYPPTSGQHSDSPATWGFHSEPVIDELAVHNLEHGGVVVSYNNIAADDVAKIRGLLATYPKDRYGKVKLVIRPYDRIVPGSLVLTAWNWIDEMSAYDEARLKAFMDAHLNRCCESVP